MSEPEHVRATRESYDAVAIEYADLFRTELREMVFGRAFLGAFAELVESAGNGPVVDVGCGPGRVTAHLCALGMDAFGVDLSPEMVALARREHPDVRYEVGRLEALDLDDEVLGGLVSWFSFIHTPPSELAGVLAEFNRVLAPGGALVLAFQVGGEPKHVGEAFGRVLDLDYQRWLPDRLAERVEAAGFATEARLVSEPRPGQPLPLGHLMARKPGAREAAGRAERG